VHLTSSCLQSWGAHAQPPLACVVPRRRSHTAAGPHLTERGRNALHLEHAARMWVRGVRILNADNAVRARGVDRSTFTGGWVGVGRVM
jgi:hypothetical protein